MPVDRLRLAELEVYDFRNPEEGDNGFHWSEIDPNWEDWSAQRYAELIDHPVAVNGFKKYVRIERGRDAYSGRARQV